MTKPRALDLRLGESRTALGWEAMGTEREGAKATPTHGLSLKEHFAVGTFRLSVSGLDNHNIIFPFGCLGEHVKYTVQPDYFKASYRHLTAIS